MQGVRSSSLLGSTRFSPSGPSRVVQKQVQNGTSSDASRCFLHYFRPYGLQDQIPLEQVQRPAHRCDGNGQIVLSHTGAAARDRQMISPHSVAWYGCFSVTAHCV